MTYDEAEKRLLDAIGDEYHVIAAFRLKDSYLFTVGEEGDDAESFDLDMLKLDDGAMIPIWLDPNDRPAVSEADRII